jgi:glutamine synthetase
MKAVDTYAPLLRAAVASAGNDHRLGANEAPPAIISIFLGDQLYDVIEQLQKGKAKSSKNGGVIQIGVTSLPQFPRDATDRNRTSPFAFTGNKFEFRAVGSSHNCSAANTVLNTIVADAIDEVCSELESAVKAKKDFNEALQVILQRIVKKHKRILFNGDNYTAEWRREAARRGLPNIMTTPEALKAFCAPATVKLFEKHRVLTKRELDSRYNALLENYEKTIILEATCSVTIARTMIVPAAVAYQRELVAAIADIAKLLKAAKLSESKDLAMSVTGQIEATLRSCKAVDKSVNAGHPAKIILEMAKLRAAVDELEGLLPRDRWPLATYAEMMFIN